MPTIEFGARESLGRVALRGAVGGDFQFVAPQFGPRCVCCNADAMGRTQQYDPSTDRVTAPAIPMPVCFECRKHALQTHTAPIMMACMLCVGIAAGALGIMKLDERPDDTFLWGMIAVGILLVSGAIAWLAISHARQVKHRANGHHAGLSFSVDGGRTALATTNEQLADELVQLNPGARRVLSRADRKRIPRAKAVDRRP